MTSPRADWRERAACLTADPELFFPVGSGAQAAAQVAAAKRVCARCPVVERCRDLAVRRGYEGVWGGLDDGERRRLRADHRTATPPSAAWHRREERTA